MARQILTGLWLSVLTCGVALAGDGSGLCGGYLGQDPPGMQPALFAPGVVSTDLGMYGTVVFTPDLTEAYWVADNSPELWWSRIENGCWTKPEVLPIKPGYRINSPVLSADGKKLYFLAAERGPGGIDRNDQIWCADRTVRGWSQPVCLPKEVNGVSKHFQFSVDADGNIYFGGGGADLYVARRATLRPHPSRARSTRTTPRSTPASHRPATSWSSPGFRAGASSCWRASVPRPAHGVSRSLYVRRSGAGQGTVAPASRPTASTSSFKASARAAPPTGACTGWRRGF